MKEYMEKIERLTKTLSELKPLKPEDQARLDKKIRLEFNYNSNHIEGNTLTYGETELLLIFDKTTGNHDHREYEEMKAHDVAFDLIKELAEDKERTLSEAWIRNLNGVLLVRPYWKEALTPDGQSTRRQIKVGDYKEYPNSVRLQNGEIFEYASPKEVPIKMGELISWYRSEEKIGSYHPLELAALLHYKFVCIHPFDDGNGRISRLLMNYVLLKNNLPPIIIRSSDKKNYLFALNQADTGNEAAFIEYIGDQLIWMLELYIKAAKGESIEEPDDLDKKISLLGKELDALDGDEEVKYQFSQDVFEKIYNSWLKDLITKAVPAVQKFNHLFTGTNHSINIAQGLGHMNFVNESSNEVIEKLSKLYEEYKVNFRPHETALSFNTFYGTLIKGGLKTFGCNYGFEVKFSQIKYEVFVDDFTTENEKSKLKFYEKLLHQPLTDAEITKVVSQLTNAIYKHIDFFTKNNGLR